jgi:hypothetical protein
MENLLTASAARLLAHNSKVTRINELLDIIKDTALKGLTEALIYLPFPDHDYDQLKQLGYNVNIIADAKYADMPGLYASITW